MADAPYPVPDAALAQFPKAHRDIITGAVVPPQVPDPSDLTGKAMMADPQIAKHQADYSGLCSILKIQPLALGSKWVEGQAWPPVAQAVPQ